MCGYFCNGFIGFMLKDKSLTDFTNLFSPNGFKKNETSNLHNQHFRLNKINEIKDYFIADIEERELMNKRLS